MLRKVMEKIEERKDRKYREEVEKISKNAELKATEDALERCKLELTRLKIAISASEHRDEIIAKFDEIEEFDRRRQMEERAEYMRKLNNAMRLDLIAAKAEDEEEHLRMLGLERK